MLLLAYFCSLVLHLITQSVSGRVWALNVLVVSLGKPVIHKLKILAEGKLKYFKSMEGTTKRKGGGQILKFRWEESWKKL